MSRWNIVITACGGCDTAAEAIRTRLSKAWSAQRPATFSVCGFDEITPKSIRKIHAVIVVVLENTSRSHVVRDLVEAHEPVEYCYHCVRRL